MKTNLFLFAALVAAFLSVASFSAAQVTIGGGDQPAAGAVLDLNSTTKGGLLLSNVSIVDLGQIPENAPNVFPGISGATTEQKQALAGMIVWNTNDFLAPNGDGLYLWDGSKWNYWGGSNGVSILTGAGLPTGSGTFSGKTCFDIAESNDGGICAPKAERQSHKTDFTIRNSQNGVQVYTFTSSGTVNNVRFGFVEAVGAGKIVESIVPVDDYSGTVSSAQVTVNYKSSLQTDLSGLTRDKGLKLKLYAIYNDGNADRSIELNISLQDCACCGAYTKAATSNDIVWRAFMCHNLGANEGADPFTPAAEIHGAMYKFGIKDTIISQATNIDPLMTGSISWWTDSVPPPSGDWDMSAKNPCPPGWRVPTADEWQGVIDNNNKYRTKNGGTSWSTGTLSWSSGADVFSNGIKFGDALVLPAAGYRASSNGTLGDRGSLGYYWSSTTAGTSTGRYQFFNSYGQGASYGSDRSDGLSVRCISE